MSQEEAGAAALGSAKVGAKAMLLDLVKDGGALDLELAALANGNVTITAILGAVAPIVKQLITSVASKMA